MQSDALRRYGWDIGHELGFEPFWKEGLEPGRVLEENRQGLRVYVQHGELRAEVSGRFRFKADSRECFPAVGDWVALRRLPAEDRGIIEAVLPRKSQFIRKVAGKQTEAQVVGANMDWVFVMMSLNQDFSVRRLERYLVLARESGASPVVILSKSDLCNNKEAAIDKVRREALEVPIHASSVITGEGLQELGVYCAAGKTIALLGSSGVGKSTLINEFLENPTLKTQPVRAHDDCGRHTTTTRQLLLLPGGAMVLDTPGMRELQLWEGEEGVQMEFEEIQLLARYCRFRDCAHQREPGCAVQEAQAAGILDAKRFQSYEKLKRELEYLNLKQDGRARQLERRRWQKLSRLARDRAFAKREGD